TLAATAIHRELWNAGAFAVTVFADGQNLFVFLRDDQRDHFLAFGQTYPANAAGGSTHRTHIGFVETQYFATAAEQHDVTVAISQRGANQAIPFIQLNRPQTNTAWTREAFQFGFLHGAVCGG